MGEWPEEACLLDKMETMDLNGNSLAGSVPVCLSSLSEMVELEVVGNAVDGLDAMCSNTWEILKANCTASPCPCCTECVY